MIVLSNPLSSTDISKYRDLKGKLMFHCIILKKKNTGHHLLNYWISMRNCFKLFYFPFYSLPFFPMTYPSELFKTPETTPLLETPEEEHKSCRRERIVPRSCSACCQAGCTNAASKTNTARPTHFVQCPN